MSETGGGFSGTTYTREVDEKRLTDQLRLVYRLMRDGQWRSVEEVAGLTELRNTRSVEAQLRNLRKPYFGGYHTLQNPEGHFVLRRNRNGQRGFSEYKIMIHREYVRAGRPTSLLAAFDEELAKNNAQKAPQNAKESQGDQRKHHHAQTDLFQGGAQ